MWSEGITLMQKLPSLCGSSEDPSCSRTRPFLMALTLLFCRAASSRTYRKGFCVEPIAILYPVAIC